MQVTRACQPFDRTGPAHLHRAWARLSRVWGLGFWDLLILAFILLLIFGTRRLPQIGRSLGGSIRGFKDAITEHVDKQDAEAEREQAQLPPAAPSPPVAAQPQADPRERDTVL